MKESKFDKLYEEVMAEHQLDEGLKEIKRKLFFKNGINKAILESVVAYAKSQTERRTYDVYKNMFQQIQQRPQKLRKFNNYLAQKFNLDKKEQKSIQAKFLQVLNYLSMDRSLEYETHKELRDEKATEFLAQALE